MLTKVSLSFSLHIFLNYLKYSPLSLMIANRPQANKIRESKMKRERERANSSARFKGSFGGVGDEGARD